ncbi:hypothetical protein CR513_39199, partial [Mucuna pruriens]
MQNWQHYLRQMEFIIHSNHQISKETCQVAGIHIDYKNCKENIVANALSRRYALLTSLQTKLLGFEIIKDLYVNDSDFGQL